MFPGCNYFYSDFGSIFSMDKRTHTQTNISDLFVVVACLLFFDLVTVQFVNFVCVFLLHFFNKFSKTITDSNVYMFHLLLVFQLIWFDFHVLNQSHQYRIEQTIEMAQKENIRCVYIERLRECCCVGAVSKFLSTRIRLEIWNKDKIPILIEIYVSHEQLAQFKWRSVDENLKR